MNITLQCVDLKNQTIKESEIRLEEFVEMVNGFQAQKNKREAKIYEGYFKIVNKATTSKHPIYKFIKECYESLILPHIGA